ncbi:MAG: hypothetical protein JO086_03395 [Acidimicrobiia bacterium]|nr:hypothetical protein [Acidimicrobiia bacterium]
MNPIADALLAVMASRAGDATGARHHLAAAQHHAQTAARRHRQVVEIARLVVAGDRQRAEGLALVHATEVPDDAELLARITGTDTPQDTR